MILSRGLRAILLACAMVAMVGACTTADSDGNGWTFRPPAEGGEAAPSGEPAGSGDPGASPEPGATGAAGGETGAGGDGPTMTDEALGVEVAVDGLTEPTGIAFLGPDDFFVIEKSTGRVIRVQSGEAGEPVLDLAVNFFDERGLLGIALHPSFAENGFVYLYWTASGQGEEDDGRQGSDTDEATAVPELGNRVDRFVWDGDQLTFDREIVAMRSNTLETDTSGRVRGNHDAGPLTFGLDGRLFIVNGDQNLRGQFQNIQDGAAPDDASFAGAVLRLEDDGSIPDDNPFVVAGGDIGGEAGENIQRTWSYGVRNSFGLVVHPQTGELWQTENGDDSWDEINILPAGSNSGWIQLIGPPERLDEYKELETASEDGLDNPDFPPDQLAGSAEEAQSRLFTLEGSEYVAPVFSWKYPVAATSIALITGSGLGESSTNTAWVGTVLTDSLLRYPLAEDGSGFDFGDDAGLGDRVDDNTAKGDPGESADYVVGTGFGVVTHIVPGPDDRLYVASISNGSVYRIGPAEEVGAGGPDGENGSPASSGDPTTQTPAPGVATNLVIGTDPGTALLFDPTEATVTSGDAVQLVFENRSTVPHNLSLAPPINTSTNTIVAAGASETIGFTAPDPGDYRYVCTLHPGMEGVLTVQAP